MLRTFTALLLACVIAGAGNGVGLAEERPSLQELLETKISLQIERDSLENSVAALVGKVRKEKRPLEIKIIGKDLQLEGITKNQSIRNFAHDDETIADILTALVIEASPIRAVKDAQDPALKLIWTIGNDPKDPEKEIVLITTREGAKKRGDKIPKRFVIPIRRGEA